MNFKIVMLLSIIILLLSSCGNSLIEVKKDIESPFFGNKASKVQMKIYTDFQCPACIGFDKRVGNYIFKEFAEKNKIGLTYKMFPLQFHKNAKRDALGALCSLAQGKFEEYTSSIYLLEDKKKGLKVTDDDRLKIAKSIGVDETLFTKCMTENHYLNKIKSDIRDGNSDKVTGTPSIYFNGKLIPLKGLTKKSISTLINNTLNK